jgi:hypothetical protein
MEISFCFPSSGGGKPRVRQVQDVVRSVLLARAPPLDPQFPDPIPKPSNGDAADRKTKAKAKEQFEHDAFSRQFT